MKKIISLFLILTTIFSLTACSKTSQLAKKYKNQTPPEFYIEEYTPEEIATNIPKEYQKYINSVKSQIEKTYNIKTIQDMFMLVNEKEKKFIIKFYETGTSNYFFCTCTRNFIEKENYSDNKIIYDYRVYFDRAAKKDIYKDFSQCIFTLS